MLDDDSGRIAVRFFDEQYQQYREILVKDALLLIEGKLRFDEFANTWVLRANKVSELERLREKEARRIVLKLTRGGRACRSTSCRRLLAQHRGGGCQVAVQYLRRAAPAARFPSAPDWNVRPTPALIEELEKLAGSRPHRGALQPAAGERRGHLRSAARGLGFPGRCLTCILAPLWQ